MVTRMCTYSKGSNPFRLTNILAGCRNGNGPDLKSEASLWVSGFDSYSRRKNNVHIYNE